MRRATSTAFSTSLGLDCHVPKPTAGIFAPVLRVYVLLESISKIVSEVCILYKRSPQIKTILVTWFAMWPLLNDQRADLFHSSNHVVLGA